MSGKLSFVGKAAIITGAGGALGKAYATDLAKRGCNLLINDIFATLNGATPAEKSQAENHVDKLIWDLKKLGVDAYYNSNSVSEGDKIVEDALKRFGRCDVLINNAGNLRDKSFAKMTNEEWESVLSVHLHGSFKLCHAIWPSMQSQNYGKIVNIGSSAGLYGNFGQANYSSAKMGILGLTNTLAKEGEKYNIAVNCVVPVAASRMTETVLSADMLNALQPDHVAPLVSYLTHDSCSISGSCFEVGGGWYSQVRLQRSAGSYLAGSDGSPASAETIQANISEITNFHDSVNPTTPADAFRAIMQAKERKPSTSSSTEGNSPTSSETRDKKTTDKAPEIATQHDYVFEHLKSFLSQVTADDLQKVRTKIVYEVKLDNQQTKYWFINTKDTNLPPVAVISPSEIDALAPHAVLKCDEATFLGLAKGNISPEFSYMKGSLQIKGNLNAAMKLKTILAMARKKLNL